MSELCTQMRELALVGVLLLLVNLASVGLAALIVMSSGF